MSELLRLLDRMARNLRWCKPTRHFPATESTPRRRLQVPTISRTTTMKNRGVLKLQSTRPRVPRRPQLTWSIAGRTRTAPALVVASAVTMDVALLVSSPFCRHRVCSNLFTAQRHTINSNYRYLVHKQSYKQLNYLTSYYIVLCHYFLVLIANCNM